MSVLCDKMEKFGKGIGNNTRYRIVDALCQGPLSVSQLAKKLKISQPAMSQHLKTLKINDIVSDERQGQEVMYSLNAKHILNLLKDLADAVQSGEVRKRKVPT